MGLRYDYTKCDKLEFINSSEVEKSKTEVIIWASLIINIDKITKKNYKDYYNRINIYEKLVHTCLLDNNNNEYYLTLQDIKNRIGLKTNVTNKSDSAFMKHMIKLCKQNIKEEK